MTTRPENPTQKNPVAAPDTPPHHPVPPVPGVAGRLLRVNLSNAQDPMQDETPTEADYRQWLGGAGLGAQVLWQEVPAEARWDHPENRLVMATGIFAGTPVWGTGGLTVVTRGVLSNGATSTQANGFFGSNLKSNGYDAIIVQGQATQPCYLLIQNGQAQLKDASHLMGLDTWEVQQALEAELGRKGHQLSVYSSGVAGENKVAFAAIEGDYGHVASKNGCGAVMGAKGLKAVAIVQGQQGITVANAPLLEDTANAIAHGLTTDPVTKNYYQWGTLGVVVPLHNMGVLPHKNYTTNEWPEGVDRANWEGPALRNQHPTRGHQCSACGMHHCHMQQVTRNGETLLLDEPEYEGLSGMGWTIGLTDPSQISWLNTQVDRACVDVNEFGWLVGWLMECQEAGDITPEQLDGLKLAWGDAEAVNTLLQKIVQREGIGDVLANGVKAVSGHFGPKAAARAIFTHKGHTPRGHDHRGRWEEMLDTCTSSVGTLEAGAAVEPEELGLPPRYDIFDGLLVARQQATVLGRRHLEDSLGACIFTTRASLKTLAQAISAITGWDYSMPEAQRFGRRTAALFRAFNLRCGIGPELERPSERYGSTPKDGAAKGADVGAQWDAMLARWYELVRYDQATGKPTKELLEELGLPEVAQTLWP